MQTQSFWGFSEHSSLEQEGKIQTKPVRITKHAIVRIKNQFG
jgi:hypothetical protein